MIMLDNGHGVNTAGKRSPLFDDNETQLFEYSYTREIAKRIIDTLVKDGYMCYLVTPEETDVPLSRRVQRANAMHNKMKQQNKTSFLISIHLNAAQNGGWANATGWSVFISPNASTKSKNLAGFLHDTTQKMNLKTRKPLPTQKYWVSNLYICKNTNCPCVLTENFFMDSKKDAEYLMSEQGKQDVVDIHVNAIKDYIDSL